MEVTAMDDADESEDADDEDECITAIFRNESF